MRWRAHLYFNLINNLMSNTRNFFQFYQRKPGQVYQDPLLRKGGTRAVEVGRASGAPSLCRGSRRPLSVTAQYVSVVTGLLTLVPPTPRYGRTPMPTYHRRTPIRRWVASSSLLRKPRARPGLRVSRGRPSNLQNGRSRPGRLGGRHSDGEGFVAPHHMDTSVWACAVYIVQGPAVPQVRRQEACPAPVELCGLLRLQLHPPWTLSPVHRIGESVRTRARTLAQRRSCAPSTPGPFPI